MQKASLILLFLFAPGWFACQQSACRAGDPSCQLETAIFSYQALCTATNWSTFTGPTSGFALVESVHQLSDQSYVVAGRATQPYGSPINAFDSPGTRNIMAMRYDAFGNLQWLTFLGQAGDRPVDMIDTGDGLLIVGTAIASFGSPLQAYSGGNEGIVLKLDYDGQLQWHKYFGTGNNEDLLRAAATGNGQYLLVGTAVGDVTNAGTIKVAHSSPPIDFMWALMIDGSGNPQWQTYIGGSASATNGRSIVKTETGYVLGALGSTTLDSPFLTVANAFSGGGTSDHLLVWLDSSGNYVRHTFQGANGQSDEPLSLNLATDGSILMGGSSNATWGTPVNPHPESTVNAAMTFAKFNADGTLVWNTFQGGAGSGGTLMSDFFQEPSGTGIFLGSANSNFGNPIVPHQGMADFVLGRLDLSSGALTGLTFNGSTAFAEQAQPHGLLRACDGSYMIAGVGTGNFGTPIVPHPGSGTQVYMRKLGPGSF